MAASGSQIERERRGLLEQVNNLGRRLEKTDLERALQLNAGLKKLVDAMASGKPAKASGR